MSALALASFVAGALLLLAALAGCGFCLHAAGAIRRYAAAPTPRIADPPPVTVLKPLHGGGGSGVIRLKADDPNLDALLELHAMIGRDQVVVQKFIPAVSEGDKRIILIDGEPVGAINRVPAKDQVRSNLAKGGRAEAVELTARDKELCAIIGPELKRRGLLFVGIDVIGDYLTEINVTSPTGAQQLKRFGGADAAAALWDVVEKKRA